VQAQGVRAVTVSVEYDFFGKKKTLREVIRPSDAGKEKKLAMILPANVHEVDYTVSWNKEGNEKREQKGKDKLGVIFWDE
jgi:hypothetical protein